MPDLESLLSLALETEGLVMLLRERCADNDSADSDFPTEKVLEMLHDKACRMAQLTQAQPDDEEETVIEEEAEAAEFEERADAEPDEAEEEETAVEEPIEEEPIEEEPIEEESIEDIEDKEEEEAPAAHRHPVFTLNDRFRFRRELFGNNDSDMADALNLIATMASYDEAEEYFYTDLCWDPKNPDVADFMAIVESAFK